MNKKIEFYLSVFSIFLSLIAIYYSCNANKISKENFNPYLKIEYMTVEGFSNFSTLWSQERNVDSILSSSQLNNIGIENVLWKIETENIKILFDDVLFQQHLAKKQLHKSDSLYGKLFFEIVHIKNVSDAVAKNLRFVITEEDENEVVNEFKIDAALNNESIILLSKVYVKDNNNDTLIIGPKSSLEKIRYDGYDQDLERKNRERFKENHIVKSINGKSLIAQCPFVYSNQSGQWVLENSIIVECNSKNKEKMTRLTLNNFDGKLKILEIEKETSYINQLFIQVVTNNFDTLIYRPTEKSLINDDKNYLVLDQNESVIIDFSPDISKQIIREILLFSKGYYIPYAYNNTNQ